MSESKRVPREPTNVMEAVAYDLIPIAPGTETWRIGRYPHPDQLWRAMYDAAPAVSDEHDDVALVVELKNLLRQHLDAMTRLDNDLAEDTRAALAKPFNVRCSNCGKTMKEHDKLARCQSTSCAALKAALRNEVISCELDFDSRCRLCGERWPNPKDERHAEGCLAAPEDAPRADVMLYQSARRPGKSTREAAELASSPERLVETLRILRDHIAKIGAERDALRAALRDVIRESDRDTDAYIRARALLAHE